MKLLHKPNSYKLQRRGDKSKSWSELPQDLINSVLERLDFADSRRAESVCSSWYSAAKRCVAKKQIPWLILLPDEDDKINNHWCKLFNPGEKDKLYKIRDEDVEFANSYCLATYGNWLFMVDYWYNLYLLNIFTHERIDLPPVESQLGTTKLERTLKAYSKKGDTFWNQIQIPVDYGCSHMYEQVDSLGNEAMLFDLGITVLANDDIVGGFKRNSIYYKTTCHEKNTTQICLFNFETKEMEPLHKFDCSSHEQLARSLWFLPSFKQT
ncbi:hypothetical protein HID58_077201 [Brassica napus]|uniref:F-box domain-containing protein n=1 Tax=Brassica napus TaxID=3708 RepID=A0ABQ7YQS3_BRANA|nr:hypothetical protein HID58_077201 [Brassica napus]